MIRFLTAAAFAALPVTAIAATHDPIAENTVVFGDSLSDPGFFGFQLTNGDVWAAQLGLDAASGRNFAVAGARAIPNPVTSDFDEQRAAFATATPTLSPYTTAVVWFGGNDLLNLSDPAEIQLALSEIASGVGELAAGFGITRFVLPGLPDLGLVPASAGIEAQASAASQAFNGGLQQVVAMLRAQGLSVAYADIASAYSDALADDAAFPFDSGTCLSGAISCDGYLFWDAVHPTEAAHARIAAVIAAEISAIPLPAGGWLLAAGLGLLAARRRRPVAA
ncbi:hypothetical protein HKCCE2091_18760 [Rhodobacterales bacterium HKCCE2091]|nr:hypothetical protein [Rhodobacterales bacterium HKCCE2091]